MTDQQTPAEPKPKESPAGGVTSVAYYNAFKPDVQSKDPMAMGFYHEMGEKYGDRAQPLTQQEVVSLLSSRTGQTISDFPDVKRQETLKGLGALQSPSAPPNLNEGGRRGSTGAAAPTRGGAGGGARGSSDPMASFMGTPKAILEPLRSPMESGAGWVMENTVGNMLALGSSRHGQGGESVKSFSRGIGKGLADTAVDMTAPQNLAFMGLLAGGGALAKIPKLAKAVKVAKLVARGGFAVEAISGLGKEFDAFKEAIAGKNYESAGQAFARGLADTFILMESTGAGKRARTAVDTKLNPRAPQPEVSSTDKVTVGGKERTVTERSNPKLVEQVTEARQKQGIRPPVPKEKQISELQDQQNRLDPSSQEWADVEKKIQALMGKAPAAAPAPPRADPPRLDSGSHRPPKQLPMPKTSQPIDHFMRASGLSMDAVEKLAGMSVEDLRGRQEYLNRTLKSETSPLPDPKQAEVSSGTAVKGGKATEITAAEHAPTTELDPKSPAFKARQVAQNELKAIELLIEDKLVQAGQRRPPNSHAPTFEGTFQPPAGKATQIEQGGHTPRPPVDGVLPGPAQPLPDRPAYDVPLRDPNAPKGIEQGVGDTRWTADPLPSEGGKPTRWLWPGAEIKEAEKMDPVVLEKSINQFREAAAAESAKLFSEANGEPGKLVGLRRYMNDARTQVEALQGVLDKKKSTPPPPVPGAEPAPASVPPAAPPAPPANGIAPPIQNPGLPSGMAAGVAEMLETGRKQNIKTLRLTSPANPAFNVSVDVAGHSPEQVAQMIQLASGGKPIGLIKIEPVYEPGFQGDHIRAWHKNLDGPPPPRP